MEEEQKTNIHVHTPLLIPQFNTLYDRLRSSHAWKHVSDNYAKGTIATTVNTTITATVTLGETPLWRLQQWPGAVQLYLVLRFFGIAPQALPTTNAGMECLFYDLAGRITPLGEFMAATGGNVTHQVLLPVPVTDPSNTAVGTLSVTLPNTANSNATYNWSFGFSAAYLLPSEEGYKLYDKANTCSY